MNNIYKIQNTINNPEARIEGCGRYEVPVPDGDYVAYVTGEMYKVFEQVASYSENTRKFIVNDDGQLLEQQYCPEYYEALFVPVG
jgi:hypothetical protein